MIIIINNNIKKGIPAVIVLFERGRWCKKGVN